MVEDKNLEPWQKIIKSKVTNSNNPQIQIKTEVTSEKKNPPIKIKVYINSEGTITLKPSSKRLSILCSKVNMASYDVKNNEWKISAEGYQLIKKDLKKDNFIFSDIPKGAINMLSKSISNNDFDLNGFIYTKLLSFQKEGVKYALNRNGRIILADDMGLGKTIQALAIAYYYRLEWPLLIIAPASLLESWVESCSVFLNEPCKIIRSFLDIGSKLSVVSYEIAASAMKQLNYFKPNVIIVDECHYLKSHTTKRTKAIVPLLQEASRVVLLSGTPAVSRPVELFPIISAIDKCIFPSFTEYGMRYCNGRKVGHWYDYKGCTNSEELYFLLKKYLMIRRTKDEVLNQLPAKFRKQIIIESKKIQNKIDADLIGNIVEPTITMQYKEAVSLKIDSVKQFLSGMIEKDVKFLVFCHHNEMMEGLVNFFNEKNVQIIRIDGSTPTHARNTLVKKFQEDINIKVGLLSITACSTGLTLTAAKVVVFAELYWNPGTLLQAEDRVHRIGQKDCVNIIYLVAKETIDEYVWPKLISKLNVLESLGIGNNQLKKMNSEVQEADQNSLDRYTKKN